ncbi:MAG: discoidin domain-containing protein [Clostridia bacterium]|nr:discoidin domain-containing protein [Clostridia bacterium]
MKFKTRIILIVLAAVIAVACFIVAACTVKPENQPDIPPVEELPNPEDYKDVTISGADDITVLQGRYFDCFSGVTAFNKDGKDLSAQIKVSGNINTSKVGEYTLLYSVANGNSKAVEKQRKVKVVANPDIGKVKPVPVYTLSSGADYNIAKGCESTSANSLNDTSLATDGDFSTRWESTHGIDDVSFTVNLGAPLDINSVNIYWEAAYAEDFTLQVSDNGLDWEILETIKGQSPERKIVYGREVYVNSFSFENTIGQFVRISCEKRKTAYGYSIYEFEVFGPTGTVIPYEEYPDLFDAEKDSSPDWKTQDEEWLIYDLGSETSVNTLRLSFKNYLTPAAYRVMYADSDGQYKEVQLKNLPYSGDTFSFTVNGSDNATLQLRYFKIEMNERRFYAPSYRINEVSFRLGDAKISVSTVSASSSLDGRGAELTVDGKDDTYWENDNDNLYQTVDLGSVKAVGRIDLYWRGDDGGKGKYYDLQISTDGENWTTVFRQTHGATAKQSVFVYDNARYLRIIDYQNPEPERFNLEGMVVHSPYPESSGEGKVKYDVSLAFPEWSVIETENGSYVTGGTDFPSSRLIAYLDDSLRGKPIPSNDWWQGLLIADKGYNMYMNPLTATFKNDGLWLTNPGEGYFDGFVPGNGSQTVNVDVHDLAVGYKGMGKDAEVRVTGYSDYGISAVMTDDEAVDKLTVFLSEGTLYAYCIFAEPEKALLRSNNFVGVYDLSGNEILRQTGSEYTGDGIVVAVLTHSSYEGGIRKYKDSEGREHENAKIFEERYYVISVPENTRFIMGENAISVIMTEGNYMSVGAVGQKNSVKEGEKSNAQFPSDEVKILHEHGYAFVIDTSCLYSFDGASNTVTTQFRLRTMPMREGFTDEAYSAYLPHQLSKSSYDKGYVYPSVRGDCRSHSGNLFTTRDTFYGAVPTFTEPTDDKYSVSVLYSQLLMVYKNNGGDKTPEESNLISGDPYWQGKNLHPMAMAAIAADQIGATDLRDKFLDKIEYILTDWFTYDPVKDKSTGAYFYYDGEWGTLYYKNSEFGAGVNLADHYFTYGYYTLASGVLSAYRHEFAEKWGDMIELLIRDYMNPDRDDELFPYMRNFDPFAGHGWAGGYADNNGGNNQESAGEALNSWVGAYLYATAVGNEKLRQAAIYGFTTELNAIKHYWFNYFNDFPESYQYGVVGQVYGGSNFYGTFFNGQPLFMYGIHLIPGEEYLTGYALNAAEREKLENLIDNMRKEQAGWDVSENEKEIYAWQHIFIPIVAIYDADEAIAWYEEVLRTQGNVGNDSEQFNVYWLIHGMKSTGVRTTDIWAENGESATVYQKDGAYNALCWNPTNQPKKFIFRNKDGVLGYAIVPAQSLVSCNPLKNTDKFEVYTDIGNFSLENINNGKNASVKDGKLVFGTDGSADYLVAFGREEVYRKIKISTASEGVKLFIDGTEIPLIKTASGFESSPVAFTFKHTLTVSGNNASIEAVTFEQLTLLKSSVQMSASASSEDGANKAGNAVDGDMTTRWESKHGNDGEWLEIELSELTEIYQMKIFWEAASASEYKVSFSETGEDDWVEVLNASYSGGARTDTFTPTTVMNVKYIRIQGVKRATDYGYSIYEVEIFNFRG